MLVSQFMQSPVVTCTPETTLQQACREMDRCKVGSLVVVGDDGHLIGIVTDRDIALKAVGWGHESCTPVAEVMSKSVVAILPDADVFEAAKRMANRGVRRMPVVGVSGAVEGMIALDDVTAAMSDEVALLRKAVSTQLSGGPGWDES